MHVKNNAPTSDDNPAAGPVDLRHDTVDVDGVRLHTATTGADDPVLLLHGRP